jgi:hypothetical protein
MTVPKSPTSMMKSLPASSRATRVEIRAETTTGVSETIV